MKRSPSKYVGKDRKCPSCGKKAGDRTRWGGHRGGWDKPSGFCSTCFERVFQGRLFDDKAAPHLDGQLEAPGLSVEHGEQDENLGPNRYRAPRIQECPTCGKEMIAFRPKANGWRVECENGHHWKSDLIVFEVMKGWK